MSPTSPKTARAVPSITPQGGAISNLSPDASEITSLQGRARHREIGTVTAPGRTGRNATHSTRTRTLPTEIWRTIGSDPLLNVQDLLALSATDRHVRDATAAPRRAVLLERDLRNKLPKTRQDFLSLIAPVGEIAESMRLGPLSAAADAVRQLPAPHKNPMFQHLVDQLENLPNKHLRNEQLVNLCNAYQSLPAGKPRNNNRIKLLATIRKSDAAVGSRALSALSSVIRSEQGASYGQIVREYLELVDRFLPDSIGALKEIASQRTLMNAEGSALEADIYKCIRRLLGTKPEEWLATVAKFESPTFYGNGSVPLVNAAVKQEIEADRLIAESAIKAGN